MQNFILKNINRFINSADAQAAAQTVESLKNDFPDATADEIVDMLIRRKCQQTGAVGMVTSGASLIPGIGTVVSMTFGVAADIGMTFKLQAELVLEIAAAYNYPLKEADKQKIILAITGLSAGTEAALQKTGQIVATKASAQLAEKAAAKAIPYLGVAASAGTNSVSTYVIGRRAQAYFSLGPDHMETWKDSLRAVTGIDEQEIAQWLSTSTESSWNMLKQGSKNTADSVIVAGKTTGTAIVVYTQKASGAITRSSSKVMGAIASGVSRINPFSRDEKEEGDDETRPDEQMVIGYVGAGDSISDAESSDPSYFQTVKGALAWRPESWKKEADEPEPNILDLSDLSSDLVVMAGENLADEQAEQARFFGRLRERFGRNKK